jgi:signal transduction histidine kinase
MTKEELILENERLKERIAVQSEFFNKQTKSAQMGEMLGVIAHQWKQPLNNMSIIISTQQLELELGMSQSDDLKKSFRTLLDNIEFLADTVDDFRHFFNPKKKKEELFLETVIDSVFSLILASLQNNNIEIIQDYKFKNKIFTFKSDLMQSVLNILKNAKDNIVEKKIENPMIAVIGYEYEDKQVIDIVDNGGGIPEDVIDKIFEPYFTTKEEENGTGLGLYITKMMIEEKCGGQLKVENIEDGVRFSIVLPIIKGENINE